MSHARLSPSAASRWMHCPGSVRLTEHLVDEGSSFAREGTAAHELGEMCLTMGVDTRDLLGHEISVDGETFIVDDEMASKVQIYVDLVRSIPGDQGIEIRLDLSDILGEEAWGTSDAVVYDAVTKTLSVVDLKYGKGVPVYAENNPQMMLYALGAYEQVKGRGAVETVEMIICQPRLDHIDSWTIGIGELLSFGELAGKAAAATREPDAPLNPGEKACRWCKGKGLCQANADDIATVLPIPVDKFDHLEPAHVLDGPETLTNEALARILPMEDRVRDFLDAARAEALRRLQAGEQIPGWKVVEGKRGPRQWKKEDTAEVERTLRQKMRYSLDEVTDRKLKSPTQIEKLLEDSPTRWQRLQPYITQSAGKPAVVPESDKRPAIADRMQDAFASYLD